MSDKTDKIQLTTINQFGVIHFYVSRDEIQTYLTDTKAVINVEQFLDTCTTKSTRMLLDWIKINSQKKVLDQE